MAKGKEGKEGKEKFLQKIKEIKLKLESSEKEKKEYLEGWKRAKADYLNYKNEEEKRNEETRKKIKESIFKDIFPALDSFELGLEMSEGREDMDKNGVKIIRNQINGALEKHGLKKMEVKEGDEFDARKHEAVAEIESEIAEGKICGENETGYILEEKVLRPAKVFISKRKGNK